MHLQKSTLRALPLARTGLLRCNTGQQYPDQHREERWRLLLNAPVRTAAMPILENYPYRLTDNVRFADLDPNQHVNNAVYASYFETGRVLLVRDQASGLMPPGFGWVLVRLDIHYRAELHWPAPLDLGLGVARIGNTSVTYEQVVFSEGKCMASAHATTVLVDHITRKPTPLDEKMISNLRRLMMPGVA